MALFKNKLFSGALFAGALFSGQAPDAPQPEDLPGRAAPSIRQRFEPGTAKPQVDGRNRVAGEALPVATANNEGGQVPTETGDSAALLLDAGLIDVDLPENSPAEFLGEPHKTRLATNYGLIVSGSSEISPPLIAGLTDDEAALLVIILAAEL